MKLKNKDDVDTVVIWAEDEKSHKEKLAYLKKHHNTRNDFILHNNDHGVRYTHNGEEWVIHSEAENPLSQTDEEIVAAMAEVERQKQAAIKNAKELARQAAIQKQIEADEEAKMMAEANADDTEVTAPDQEKADQEAIDNMHESVYVGDNGLALTPGEDVSNDPDFPHGVELPALADGPIDYVLGVSSPPPVQAESDEQPPTESVPPESHSDTEPSEPAQ